MGNRVPKLFHGYVDPPQLSPTRKQVILATKAAIPIQSAAANDDCVPCTTGLRRKHTGTAIKAMPQNGRLM